MGVGPVRHLVGEDRYRNGVDVNSEHLLAAIKGLSDTEAYLLINVVASERNWSKMVLMRGHAESVAGRDLTDEEWSLLSGTASWACFIEDRVVVGWRKSLHNLMVDLELLSDADG